MNQKRFDLEVVVFENKLTKKKYLVLPFIVDKDYLHPMGEKVPAKPNVEAVLSLRLQCSPPGPAHLPASAQQHSTRKPFPSKEVGIDCIRHSRDTSLQGLDPQIMSCSVVKKLPP